MASKELFSLGEIYPSDFLKQGEEPRSKKVELKLMIDDDGCVHLNKTASNDVMYGKYWYRSGINNTMRSELKDIVDSIMKIYPLKENDIWLDIACNDGTLLSYVSKDYIRIGIDPADDSYLAQSEKHADLILQEYFSAKIYQNTIYGRLKAKVITSIAMFYDLSDPEGFIKDIDEVLDDNGLWVMQLSYTPLMLEQTAFDNICHEHIYYYSLFNLKTILERNGFKIVDCQLNDVNGGSFRVYIMKYNAEIKYLKSKPYTDVCDMRTWSTFEYEKLLDLEDKQTWISFFDRIKDLKHKTVSFIKKEKAKGKTIWAYGASTKGNTLLQYFELDETLITGIAERNKDKWGLRTVGSNIPIYSEEEMRQAKPDYLLILPWHFIQEFKLREKEYLLNGGSFIVPCPKFEII